MLLYHPKLTQAHVEHMTVLLNKHVVHFFGDDAVCWTGTENKSRITSK
jgi:hypothetical protein